ncbi:VOC family protein [Demequina silvatica]|uniref:VOC family protein n=1 Tax=Demequina silvatica TaxID=1638988 RepID=UPI000784C012|nr:VOC family protein [Demequina silvatica]
MATVSTYLNFDGTCEEAFGFYREVFGGDFAAPLQRIGEVPQPPGVPPLSDEEADRVMHVALETVGGHLIHGTDIVPSMGHVLVNGNAISINLELDDEDDLRDIWGRLSAGADIEMEPTPMFWGQLFASFEDRYGIRWMMVAPLTEGTGLA